MSDDTVRFFLPFARRGPLAYNSRHYDLIYQQLDPGRCDGLAGIWSTIYS